MILKPKLGLGLLLLILRLLPCVILVPLLQTRILYPGNIRRIFSFIAFLSFPEVLLDMILILIWFSIPRYILQMVLIMSKKKRFEQMEFFTAYDPPKVDGLKFSKASLTRQEFAKDADINNIMRKYSQGMAPIPSGTRPPLFGDFSNGIDYQACLDKVIKAQEAFDSLPSQLRDRFGNDPAKLLDFISDEKNRDEAVKLGLIDSLPADKKPVVDNPVSVPDKGATE